MYVLYYQFTEAYNTSLFTQKGPLFLLPQVAFVDWDIHRISEVTTANIYVTAILIYTKEVNYLYYLLLFIFKDYHATNSKYHSFMCRSSVVQKLCNLFIPIACHVFATTAIIFIFKDHHATTPKYPSFIERVSKQVKDYKSQQPTWRAYEITWIKRKRTACLAGD